MYYESTGAATGGVASRRVHDITKTGPGDQRALQNTESHCRRNAGQGRTADVRDITTENLADDVAALLKLLRSRERTYRLQHGRSRGVQCAIAIRTKCEGQVIISSTFRRDGMIAEALEAIPKLTADAFQRLAH